MGCRWFGQSAGLGVATLFVLALTTSVKAGEMPVYEVEDYCNKLSAAAGGSNQVYNYCVDQQQEAYDKLKADWQSVPDRTVSHCSRLGEAAGGSYQVLKYCIDQETAAAADRPAFRR